MFDLVISNATLLDPATRTRTEADIGVAHGRIDDIGDLSSRGASQRIDAAGHLVSPGLVDFHVHAYWGVSPYGLEVDPICIANGATTAVDAGSSGSENFSGFRRFIAENSNTRLLAFVSLARQGIAQHVGELVDLRNADSLGAIRTISANPDRAVGVKIRLTGDKVGDNGPEALGMAIDVGRATDTPVMVHIGKTLMSIEEIADAMRPGDIITHCFTPFAPSIVNENGRIRDAVWRARERGVLFDVGYAGQVTSRNAAGDLRPQASGGHFQFDIARECAAQGFWPDIISSDLHARLAQPNASELCPVLTRFLALGMDIDHAISCCTVVPARALGWHDRIGTIEPGREADLAVLEVIDGEPMMLTDTTGATFQGTRSVRALHTVRAGRQLQ